jgi:hypothetical protein
VISGNSVWGGGVLQADAAIARARPSPSAIDRETENPEKVTAERKSCLRLAKSPIPARKKRRNQDA